MIKITISEKIITHAKNFPEKIAFKNKYITLTYQQLATSLQQLASRLAVQTKKGDTIIVRLAKSHKQLIFLLAAAQAGLKCILVEPERKTIDFDKLVTKTEPELIITKDFKLPKKSAPTPEIKTTDIFLGALSSGTTGQSKISWRDQQSWIQAFKYQSEIFNLSQNDNLLLTGSLVYTANLNNTFHLLFEGGSIFFAESKHPRNWVKMIKTDNITAIFMLPGHYRLLLKKLPKPLTQIKSLTSAGAKLNQAIVKKMQHFFPQAKIVEYYGASELGHVSYASVNDILTDKSTIGKAFPEVKIEIKDGLIWVESPYLAVDYRPQASAGDKGYLKNGQLYLTGRADVTK